MTRPQLTGVLRVGLSAWRHKLVEEARSYGDHLEAGVLKALGVRGPLVEDVHTTLFRGLLGRAHPREVVGPVAAVRGREVYIIGPDYVRVSDLFVVVEGVDDGQVPATLLDEDHVPHAAPVVQDGGVRGRVIGDGLDLFAPPVDVAHVVLRRGFAYTEQR